MTVTRDVTVWCDHGYDPASGRRECPDWITGDTAVDARRNAKALGWQHWTSPTRDLCRRHAEITRSTP